MAVTKVSRPSPINVADGISAKQTGATQNQETSERNLTSSKTLIPHFKKAEAHHSVLVDFYILCLGSHIDHLFAGFEEVPLTAYIPPFEEVPLTAHIPPHIVVASV
jgi:hypothetical protein